MHRPFQDCFLQQNVVWQRYIDLTHHYCYVNVLKLRATDKSHFHKTTTKGVVNKTFPPPSLRRGHLINKNFQRNFFHV